VVYVHMSGTMISHRQASLEAYKGGIFLRLYFSSQISTLQATLYYTWNLKFTNACSLYF